MFCFCFSFSKYIIYTQWSTIHQWEKKGRERNEKHDDHHHRPNDISSYWQWKHQTDRHYSLMSRCVVVSIKLMMQTNQKKEKNTDTVAAVGLNRSNHHELWSFFTRLTIFCVSLWRITREKIFIQWKERQFESSYFLLLLFSTRNTHTQKKPLFFIYPNHSKISDSGSRIFILLFFRQIWWSSSSSSFSIHDQQQQPLFVFVLVDDNNRGCFFLSFLFFSIWWCFQPSCYHDKTSTIIIIIIDDQVILFGIRNREKRRE